MQIFKGHLNIIDFKRSVDLILIQKLKEMVANFITKKCITETVNKTTKLHVYRNYI